MALQDIPVGQFLRIPCKFIKGQSDAQPVVIKSIAEALKSADKNVMPVFVRATSEDRYQGILNLQVLEGARQAGLDFVWCIVVDNSMKTQLLTEIGQIVQANILTASEQELLDMFEYIKSQVSGFSKIDPQKAAKGIVEYRQSKKIANLNFLTKLKCGIGRSKLDGLVNYLIVD